MKRKGPQKAELKLTAQETEALKRLTRRSRSSRHQAFRAKIVLHCASSLTNSEVARKMHTMRSTVGKWRSRFVKQRLEGLYDEPRPGVGRTITDDRLEEVVPADQDAGDNSRGKNRIGVRALWPSILG